MKRTIFTILSILVFTYLSGSVIYGLLECLELVSNPNTSDALKNVLRFALGVPVLILELVAVRYAVNLIKNLNL